MPDLFQGQSGKMARRFGHGGAGKSAGPSASIRFRRKVPRRSMNRPSCGRPPPPPPQPGQGLGKRNWIDQHVTIP